MHKKKILIFAFLGFALASGVVLVKSGGLFDSLDRYFEKKYYNTQTEIRHVRIAGIDLWIPKNYKFGGYDSEELDQRSVGLQVLLPNLDPRTKENIEGFTKGNGWANRMLILLDDFSQSADINRIYKKRLELTLPHEPIDNLYGFDKAFKSSYPDDPKVILGMNFYVIKKNEHIISFIECDIGKRVKAQGCQQYFVYNEKIIIKISYSSRFLPDWKNLETKTIELIENFKKQPPEGEPL